MLYLPVIKVFALVYRESTSCIGPLNTVADPVPSIMTLNNENQEKLSFHYTLITSTCSFTCDYQLVL